MKTFIWFFAGVAFFGFLLTDAEWKPLRYFCAVVGHRWYFVISFPTLESGEIYCRRCGKIEIRKDLGWRNP